MANQSNITLNTHVYNPRGLSQGVASWVDPLASSGAAVAALSESVRGPNASGNTRVLFKLTLPKLATEDSACACVGAVLGEALVNIDVLIPGAFTAAERENLQLQITALAASNPFVDAVKNLIGSW